MKIYYNYNLNLDTYYILLSLFHNLGYQKIFININNSKDNILNFKNEIIYQKDLIQNILEGKKYPENSLLYITLNSNFGEKEKYLINHIDTQRIYSKSNIGKLKYFNKESINGNYYIYYRKNNFGEIGYLNLSKKILLNGEKSMTRNGYTLSLFGETLKFDLSQNNFPLLTTKKMFLRGIIEELLWFLRGETDSKILEKKKVKIWKGNSSSQFLKNRKLDYQEGDIGPMYGFQWRHYGEQYHGCQYQQYQGFDQLKKILNMIIKDPQSRRILMTTYNPQDVDKSVLAPCHGIKIQFNVINKNIDLHMDMRSCDHFLGNPFNIASYALLLKIIAHVTNLNSRNLVISYGNIHLYQNHLEQAKLQLERIPYSQPKLKISKEFKDFNNVDKMIQFIESLKYQDFLLEEYKFYPKIKANMNV